MSVAYRYELASGVAYALWEGKIADKDWLRAAVSQIESDLSNAQKLYLFDLRLVELDELECTLGPSSTTPQLLKGGPAGRLAVVAGMQFPVFDRCVECVLGPSLNCLVFNSLETACRWLGIDLAAAELQLSRLRTAMAAD